MHKHNSRLFVETPATPLFRAEQLGFSYPDGTRALGGVDLTIAGGERVALVGHNGSGKTTLARQLCGLNIPSEGRLLYRDQPLIGAHLEAARLRIGLLFQDPDDQLFGHTLVEDVAFGPCNQGLSLPEAREVALEMLRQVGLEQLAFKPPHQLSYGQKKRAALAGLLAMQPEVLILDEPTTNLDPRQEEVFLHLLHDFPGTLICISHDLIFLYELCRRAVVLERGGIHHDYAISTLVSQREALREHGLDFSFRFSTSPPVELVEPVEIAETELPAELPQSESYVYCPRNYWNYCPRNYPVYCPRNYRNYTIEPVEIAATTAAPGRESNPAASPCPLPNPPLLETRNLDYRYPDGTHALRQVNLVIGEGERVAIVGENGAGKSTLLRSLLGLHPTRGDYTFAGRRVSRKGRGQLWRQIGMVFQECADQLFCPTVADEVSFGLEQARVPRAQRQERVAAALRQVHLDGFEARVPLHLSGGERKRLAMACVLVMEPRLLILDEPTAGLDPQGEELLLEILRHVECSLLLVSHDIYVVGELTRRTLVMHQGCVIEDLPTHLFLADQRLSALNGLAYSYRQRSSDAIRELQHLHEHRHSHRHLHEHTHRHDDLEHTHLHEHEHEHQHRFVHVHQEGAPGHSHSGRQLHEHEHPGHEQERHEHDHSGTLK